MDILTKMMALFCTQQCLPISSWLVAGAHQEMGEPKPLLFCWFLFVLSELLQTQSLGYFEEEMSLCCRHFNRDTHKDLLKRSGEYKIIK